MRDQEPAAQEEKASALAVWAWAFYDFANTIFAISILSYCFPLWLGDELGAGAGFYNYIVAASAFLVASTAPFLGSLADFRQRRRPYLVLLTILSVAATAALTLSGGVAAGVTLFIVAVVTYQSALVFYNALLPSVSVGRKAGRVSGYGISLGYVGSIVALLTLTVFVTRPEAMRALLGPLGGWIQTGSGHNANAFLPTAVLYLVFSLPAFLLVPDREVREPRPFRFGDAFQEVVSTVRNFRGSGGLGLFIVATLLYTDAANTAVTNMSLYGRQVFAMDQGQIRNLLLFSTVFAVVGSVGFGFASDRFGPKRALLAVLVLWMAAILTATFAVAPWMLLVAGPLVGIALGATWTVSRVMLLALSPPEKLGESFGLYSIVGRLSAIMGPLLTGALLTVFGGLGEALSYRISIGSLALVMLAGMVLLARVPDARPGPAVAAFAPETTTPEKV
ncbi:MAG: MFS transporter [Rubrobacteraceae bacterium]